MSHSNQLKIDCIHVNDVFGRLTVIEKVSTQYVVCKCQCGKIKKFSIHSLLGKVSNSCGCLHKQMMHEKFLTHGMTKSGTYKSWAGMISRCTNPKNPNFKDYLGRGITVCKRWLDFNNFFEDMGLRPSNHSIERIDNNGNYEPGNCRWATQAEQTLNTRKNVYITYQGKTLTLSQWSKETGINQTTLSERFKKNLPLNIVFLKGTIPRKRGVSPKLNDELVLEIRKKYSSKQYTCASLGELYGVSKYTITAIICRKTWTHI